MHARDLEVALGVRHVAKIVVKIGIAVVEALDGLGITLRRRNIAACRMELHEIVDGGGIGAIQREGLEVGILREILVALATVGRANIVPDDGKLRVYEQRIAKVRSGLVQFIGNQAFHTEVVEVERTGLTVTHAIGCELLQRDLGREIDDILRVLAKAPDGIDMLTQHQMLAAPIPARAHLDRLELRVHTEMPRHCDIETHHRQAIALPVLECLHRRARAQIVILQVQIAFAEKQLLQSVDYAVVGRTIRHIGFEVVDDLLIECHRIQIREGILPLIENRRLQFLVGGKRQLQPHHRTRGQQAHCQQHPEQTSSKQYFPHGDSHSGRR